MRAVHLLLGQLPSLAVQVMVLAALLGARRRARGTYHFTFLLTWCLVGFASLLGFALIQVGVDSGRIMAPDLGRTYQWLNLVSTASGAILCMGVIAWAIDTWWPRPRREPVWRLLLLTLVTGGAYAAYWTVKRSIDLLPSRAGRASALVVVVAEALHARTLLLHYADATPYGGATPALLLGTRLLLGAALLVNALALRAALNREIQASAVDPGSLAHYRCSLLWTLVLGALYLQRELNAWGPARSAAAEPDAGLRSA